MLENYCTLNHTYILKCVSNRFNYNITFSAWKCNLSQNIDKRNISLLLKHTFYQEHVTIQFCYYYFVTINFATIRNKVWNINKKLVPKTEIKIMLRNINKLLLGTDKKWKKVSIWKICAIYRFKNRF